MIKLNIFKKTTSLIFIGGVVLVLLLMHQCNSNTQLKNEIENVKRVSVRDINNLKASLDSVTTEKSVDGTLVFSKSAFEYEINDLKKQKSEILKKYSSVLNKNAKLETINSLISAELELKDSIINSMSSIEQDENSIKVKFNDKKEIDKYNWRQFNGEIVLIKNDKSEYSILNSKFNIEQKIGISASIVKEEGRNFLKISTKYPGVEFTNIENINLVNDKLNQKQTKKGGFAIGFGVGYGYNLNNNQIISTGPSIGLGLYYSPKWLRF